MLQLDTRRTDMPRSHRDRHPGLMDNLDNPHPLEGRVPVVKRLQRSGNLKTTRTREASPR